jgi:hypothetical protein
MGLASYIKKRVARFGSDTKESEAAKNPFNLASVSSTISRRNKALDDIMGGSSGNPQKKKKIRKKEAVSVLTR